MDKIKMEYERRYLLKQSPKNIKKFPRIYIQQFYSSKTGARYRKSFDFSTGVFSYEKIIKKNVGFGTNEEKIIGMTEDDFELFLEIVKQNPDTIRQIEKTRYNIRHPFNNHQIWEVDVFTHLSLVIAEIELSAIEEPFTIPDIITDQLIMEITQYPQFRNYNLAYDPKF